MMTYSQSTGRLMLGRTVIGVGYSGAGIGLNNPDLDDVRNVGPIPRGIWRIGAPFDHRTKGPAVLRLTPTPGCDVHERSGFLIHGDSIAHPGTASQGCIVLPRAARRRIVTSGARALTVIR